MDRTGGLDWWTGLVDRTGRPGWWTGLALIKIIFTLPNEAHTCVELCGSPADFSLATLWSQLTRPTVLISEGDFSERGLQSAW